MLLLIVLNEKQNIFSGFQLTVVSEKSKKKRKIVVPEEQAVSVQWFDVFVADEGEEEPSNERLRKPSCLTGKFKEKCSKVR